MYIKYTFKVYCIYLVVFNFQKLPLSIVWLKCR